MTAGAPLASTICVALCALCIAVELADGVEAGGRRREKTQGDQSDTSSSKGSSSAGSSGASRLDPSSAATSAVVAGRGEEGAYGGAARSQEAKLLSYLLDGYEPLVRPAMNASTTVIVSLGVSLAQLLDVDEKSQIMTTLIWLRQEWIDERLRWDPNRFYGIKRLYVISSLVWVPDIVLYNTMDIAATTLTKSRVALNYDGSISWKPMVKFSSACRIDITYFPFDDQICWLKMGSWSYDGFQVDVVTLSSVVATDGYVPNDDFDLVNATLTRQLSHYGCCPEPFPDVIAHLHLRRRTLYYVFNIIVPCSMLTLISLLSFLLPPNYREQKIMIQLSILLSFSFFKLVVVEVTPSTSDAVPLLGTYLTALMALISMSTIAHMVAAHIILAEGITQRISHRCLKVSYLISTAMKSVTASRLYSCSGRANKKANQHCRLATAENDHLEDECSTDSTAPPPRHRVSNEPAGGEYENRAVELVQKALGMLRLHQQAAAERQLHEARWLRITAAVDKTFFFIYLLAVFSVTMTLFIVRPMSI